MYEHHTAPVLPRRHFFYRLLRHFVLTLMVVGGSLVIGVAGYHLFAGFSWIDSLLNAAMLLGGMGPIGDIPTVSGKLFASAYALYAGLVLITATGIMLAPIMHRVLHMLHSEQRH
jgi:hypothetical protein